MKLLDGVLKAGTKVVTKVNNPKTFVIGGTVLLVGAVVVAHRAGRKVEETLYVNKEQIKNLKEIREAGVYQDEEGKEIEFSEQDYKSELFKSYISFGWDMAKLYVPVFGLTVGSAACYIYGHKKMAKALAGMTALYLSTDEAFKKYRKNVVTVEGEEADERYYYGLTDSIIEEYKEKKIDEKTGEEVEFGKAKKREVFANGNKNDISALSQYAVFAEPGYCGGITKDWNYSQMWLDNIESLANGMLASNPTGIVYLADIYETLGCVHELDQDKMLMAHECGWVRGKGDGFIKFIIKTIRTYETNQFGERVECTRRVLDFNCPGSVRAQLAA